MRGGNYFSQSVGKRLLLHPDPAAAAATSSAANMAAQAAPAAARTTKVPAKWTGRRGHWTQSVSGRSGPLPEEMAC